MKVLCAGRRPPPNGQAGIKHFSHDGASTPEPIRPEGPQTPDASLRKPCVACCAPRAVAGAEGTNVVPAAPPGAFTTRSSFVPNRPARGPPALTLSSGNVPGEDNTGLNGIRLHCSDGTTIQSSMGAWGWWQRARYCPRGYLRAFSLGVQPRQDARDDVAATSLRVACSDGELLAGDAGDREGPWNHPCLSGSVCGLQTRVEEPRGQREDSTALNDIRFFCCPP
ncbi:vitelline membrane outer layer protein 1-like [Chelonoidis abingdonii]|uniref:vitelline membrane outer layer protein 1-like n=1 Tax=Chelonoidis abingdonii TaxID=106734 RepID=UPI003F4919EE